MLESANNPEMVLMVQFCGTATSHDQLDVGRIMRQPLQHQREDVAIENFNNILFLVSSKCCIQVMDWIDDLA
jgi:hypothetical protein